MLNNLTQYTRFWQLKVSILAFLVMATISAATGGQYFDNLELGIPGKCDQIVNREGYALGYSRKFKQPLWVAYRITKDEAEAQKVSRKIASFYEDTAVSDSPTLLDYNGSGYDRGHLAPAGDMKFSITAMRESFSLANISPQVNSFNGGIWHRLEQIVRNSASREESLFVVTGPVFVDDDEPKFIGVSKIRVPEFFYKVIFDETPPQKMIGFIIRNRGSKKPLSSFALPVDEVEEVTGLDFFSALPIGIQESLEKQCDCSLWGL